MSADIITLDGIRLESPVLDSGEDIGEVIAHLQDLHSKGMIKAVGVAIVLDNDSTIKDIAYKGYVAPAMLIGALELTKEFCIREANKNEKINQEL